MSINQGFNHSNPAYQQALASGQAWYDPQSQCYRDSKGNPCYIDQRGYPTTEYIPNVGLLVGSQKSIQLDYQGKPIQTINKSELKNKFPPKEEKKMGVMGEVTKDVQGFIKEHKYTIYWLAILFLVDHFMFHGAFKEKLKAQMEKFVGKVENKLDEAMK